MNGHPRDEWVDVTQFGDAAPRMLLAVDSREAEIAEARDLYLHDRIDIEEFERRVRGGAGRGDAVSGTQLTLDGRDMRVKAYVQKWYGPDWWAAKCVACGVALTKYAFSEEDARAEAVDALDRVDRWQHQCKAAP